MPAITTADTASEMVRSATSTALRVAARELELYDTGNVAGTIEVFAGGTGSCSSKIAEIYHVEEMLKLTQQISTKHRHEARLKSRSRAPGGPTNPGVRRTDHTRSHAIARTLPEPTRTGGRAISGACDPSATVETDVIAERWGM
ncbi:MAG: hypothetical protein HOV92_06365 [Streptomyces sp.]|nr:hypothetical protein [Streptomyces sp.]